jgi:hypothetical protein
MRHNEPDFEITDICFERKSVKLFNNSALGMLIMDLFIELFDL